MSNEQITWQQLIACWHVQDEHAELNLSRRGEKFYLSELKLFTRLKQFFTFSKTCIKSRGFMKKTSFKWLKTAWAAIHVTKQTQSTCQPTHVFDQIWHRSAQTQKAERFPVMITEPALLWTRDRANSENVCVWHDELKKKNKNAIWPLKKTFYEVLVSRIIC